MLHASRWIFISVDVCTTDDQTIITVGSLCKPTGNYRIINTTHLSGSCTPGVTRPGLKNDLDGLASLRSAGHIPKLMTSFGLLQARPHSEWLASTSPPFCHTVRRWLDLLRPQPPRKRQGAVEVIECTCRDETGMRRSLIEGRSPHGPRDPGAGC